MGKKRKYKTLFITLFIVCCFVFLYFFYKKYVPFVESFQIVLLPVILLVFFSTIINRKVGLLFFIFFFPLINSLPYFFGISESIPHAPTALVLFLFFFPGWVINLAFIKKINLKLDLNIYKPQMLFASLVLISGVITFFRYINFFPFLADAVYEFKTNAIGVTSGGAVMSTVFFSLSYLTAFSFFFIFMHTVKEKRDLFKVIYTLCLSAFISFIIGIIQFFGNVNPGINPRIVRSGYINATFKDSLSLGAFVAVVFTLFLGMFFYEKKIKKPFFFVLLGMSFLTLLVSGSKSGFLCLLASVILFMLLAAGWRFKISGLRFLSLKNIIVFLLIGLFVFLSFYFVNKLDIKNKYVKELATFKRLSISKNKGILTSLIDSRDHLWKSGLLMMKDYPFTGIGVGAFIIELANYAEKHDISIKMPESAENYFINAGAELGIIGLLVIIWVYWLILKRMWLQYSNITSEGGKKSAGLKRKKNRINYLYIGLICGIVAYFINIQAHTYIGSYEIKYTFWLLVGLLFCLGRIAENGEEEEGGGCEEARLNEGRENGESMSSEGAGEGIEKEDGGRKEEKYVTSEKREKGEGRLKSGRIYKLFVAVFIIFYAGIHLWNSTHSLSLAQRSEELGIKQEFGFYRWEKDNEGRKFRWTRSYGGMEIEIGEEVMEIPLLASHPDIEKKPVKVRIYLVKDFFKEKRLLDEIVLKQNIWQTYEYSLPEEVGEKVILLFKVSRTWNPQKWHGTPDPRNLGIAVGQIRWGSVPASVTTSFYRALDFIPTLKRDDVFVGLVTLNI